MKVSVALSGISLLFLDTAPVIYLVEQNPAYFACVEQIFARLDNGQIRAVTSPVTLAETLVHPLKLNLPQLRQHFIDVIVHGANTTFATIGQPVAEEAARLRATYQLRLPDSLQLATALDYGCDAFLTNDTQLKRVTELKVLVIDELEAD